MEFLSWLENTDAVTWIRESTSLLGYTMYLSLHTLGLVFLLGPVVIIALRLMGLTPRMPIAPLRAFFPLMLGGFVVNVASGLVLFATAPVSFVRNITFLVKLACVLLAAGMLQKFLRAVFSSGEAPDVAVETPLAKRLFAAQGLLWVVAITAGRLTAYSAFVIKQTVWALAAAFVVVVVVILVARALLARRQDDDPLASTLAVPLKGK